MKNNTKKAPVKFWEDLLYFQHFMHFFLFLLQIGDYHHLKFTVREIYVHSHLTMDLNHLIRIEYSTGHNWVRHKKHPKQVSKKSVRWFRRR